MKNLHSIKFIIVKDVFHNNKKIKYELNEEGNLKLKRNKRRDVQGFIKYIDFLEGNYSNNNLSSMKNSESQNIISSILSEENKNIKSQKNILFTPINNNIENILKNVEESKNSETFANFSLNEKEGNNEEFQMEILEKWDLFSSSFYCDNEEENVENLFTFL